MLAPVSAEDRNIDSYTGGYFLAEESYSKHPADEDILDRLSPSNTVQILFPLSQPVLGLLGYAPKIPEPLPRSLPQRLIKLLQASEVLWKGPFADHKMVVKCAADIVV